MSGMTPAERDALDLALIASVLGVPPEEVSHDLLWAYLTGAMDEGASCAVWLQRYRPPVGGHSDFDLARELNEVGDQR